MGLGLVLRRDDLNHVFVKEVIPGFAAQRQGGVQVICVLQCLQCLQCVALCPKCVLHCVALCCCGFSELLGNAVCCSKQHAGVEVSRTRTRACTRAHTRMPIDFELYKLLLHPIPGKLRPEMVDQNTNRTPE